jgi:hypothetical protein
MEKAPIKKFAVEARKKLKADVTFQLERYGITENGIVEPQTSTDKELVFDLGNGNTQTIKGERYVNQYRNLAAHVRGFYADGSPKQQLEQFIEEIAFTWFNRLIAIRFMEVNRYLPVRVLSSEITGQKLPDLVKAPFSGDLEFTEDEKKRIFELQDANKEDDLFRFLFFKQCNDLSRILPRLFENLEGHNSFSELLITLSFNDPNGVVYRLVNEVDERWFDIHTVDEDGKPIGQVQIIGWMYQYYNTEPKDKVFADLKKNIKISKQNIPAATQLFTPDWIVRYMVENSLGRLWYEGHPGFDKSEWKYYLDEAPQEPQVEQQLEDIRAQYAKMEPEQLKVIDPCMGSGHILCYLFDVLMQIYLDNGYSKREAVRSILENNLFGLDIDKRAAQIAYFSVMMKAREYDSNFFSRSNIPQPRVYDIQESNWLGGAYKHEMGNFLNSQQHRDTLNYLLDTFVDAKEYGSILQIKPLDYEGLKEAWETSAAATAHDANMAMWYDAAKDAVAQLIEQAIMLSQKYDAVVTNPPYMGSSGMGAPLANFVKKYYPDSKSDLFAVFIEVCSHMAAEKRYQAMITQHAWMFLSSYEKLREKMMLTETVNMAHLGARAFEEIGGEVVQTTSFVRCRTHIDDYKGTYCRLIEPTTQQGKEDMFLAGGNRYFANQDNFAKIPGSPVAYWLSNEFINLLSSSTNIGRTYQSGSGLSTADNERFLRFFWEVNNQKIANKKDDKKKWFLFNKGGEYRKWYGNLQHVVNWENDGEEIKYWVTHNPKDPNTTSWSRRIFNTNLYFLAGVTWSVISSGKISFRAIDTNAMISNAAGGVFGFKDCHERNAFMAAVNSCIWTEVFSTINPTLNYSSGVIQKAPTPKIIDSDLCDECVELSKKDWDSFENSWDFKKHPLV